MPDPNLFDGIAATPLPRNRVLLFLRHKAVLALSENGSPDPEDDNHGSNYYLLINDQALVLDDDGKAIPSSAGEPFLQAFFDISVAQVVKEAGAVAP